MENMHQACSRVHTRTKPRPGLSGSRTMVCSRVTAPRCGLRVNRLLPELLPVGTRTIIANKQKRGAKASG